MSLPPKGLGTHKMATHAISVIVKANIITSNVLAIEELLSADIVQKALIYYQKLSMVATKR